MSKKREPQVIIPLSEYERLTSIQCGQPWQDFHKKALGWKADAEKYRSCLPYIDDMSGTVKDAELGALVRKMPIKQFLVHNPTFHNGPWSVQEEVGVDRSKTVSVGATPEEALRAALEKT